MKSILADIALKETADGGKTIPITGPIYSCPVFFDDIAALANSGWDCRILIGEHGEPIPPGGGAHAVAIVFLSPEIVLPHMKVGVTFTLWEGRTIGSGTVVEV